MLSKPFLIGKGGEEVQTIGCKIGCIVQHGEYSQHFVTTANEV